VNVCSVLVKQVNAVSLQVGKLKYQDFHDLRSQMVAEREYRSPSSLYTDSSTTM